MSHVSSLVMALVMVRRTTLKILWLANLLVGNFPLDVNRCIYGCWTKNRGGKPPEIIHFNRVFHYKPSMLGGFYPLFLGWHPYIYIYNIYIYIIQISFLNCHPKSLRGLRRMTYDLVELSICSTDCARVVAKNYEAKIGIVKVSGDFDVLIDLSTASHIPAKFIQIQCDVSG